MIKYNGYIILGCIAYDIHTAWWVWILIFIAYFINRLQLLFIMPRYNKGIYSYPKIVSILGRIYGKISDFQPVWDARIKED
jgi:hypothetical protein